VVQAGIQRPIKEVARSALQKIFVSRADGISLMTPIWSKPNPQRLPSLLRNTGQAFNPLQRSRTSAPHPVSQMRRAVGDSNPKPSAGQRPTSVCLNREIHYYTSVL